MFSIDYPRPDLAAVYFLLIHVQTLYTILNPLVHKNLAPDPTDTLIPWSSFDPLYPQLYRHFDISVKRVTEVLATPRVHNLRNKKTVACLQAIRICTREHCLSPFEGIKFSLEALLITLDEDDDDDDDAMIEVGDRNPEWGTYLRIRGRNTSRQLPCGADGIMLYLMVSSRYSKEEGRCSGYRKARERTRAPLTYGYTSTSQHISYQIFFKCSDLQWPLYCPPSIYCPPGNASNSWTLENLPFKSLTWDACSDLLDIQFLFHRCLKRRSPPLPRKSVNPRTAMPSEFLIPKSRRFITSYETTRSYSIISIELRWKNIKNGVSAIVKKKIDFSFVFYILEWEIHFHLCCFFFFLGVAWRETQWRTSFHRSLHSTEKKRDTDFWAQLV